MELQNRRKKRHDLLIGGGESSLKWRGEVKITKKSRKEFPSITHSR